jgi:hypothetical protein
MLEVYEWVASSLGGYTDEDSRPSTGDDGASSKSPRSGPLKEVSLKILLGIAMK